MNVHTIVVVVYHVSSLAVVHSSWGNTAVQSFDRVVLLHTFQWCMAKLFGLELDCVNTTNNVFT